MKNTWIKRTLALVTALSLFGAGSLSAFAQETESEGGSEVTLEDIFATDTDFSGVTLTVWGMPYTQDLLDAAGVGDTPYTLELATYSGGSLALQAMAVDQLDFAQSSEIPPLYAALTDNGGNFAIVAGYTGSTLGQELIVGPGHDDITEVSQLKGQKVGYVEATTAHYFLAKMLEEAGLTWDDIDAVPLAPSDGLSALISGDIVAFAVFGFAQINANEAAGGHLLESAADILSGNYCYNANLQTLKDPVKAEAIVDYIARTQYMFQWQNEHIEEYAEITKDYTSEEPEQYIAELEAQVNQKETAVITNNDEAKASLQDVADTLYGLGVLEEDVDVNTLYTDQLTDAIQEKLDLIGELK